MRNVLILSLLALTHCATGPRTGVDEKVNLFPLVRYETRDEPQGHTLDILWPFYQHETIATATQSHLLPLWWSADDGQGSTFLNLLVLYWRNAEPGDTSWHLFPFLHFQDSDAVDNAHVWPIYGRKTVRGEGQPTSVTHSVAWPLNEFTFRDDGTSHWWLLGIDELFSVAHAKSSLAVREADADEARREQRNSEYGVVSALNDSIALWHSERRDVTEGATNEASSKQRLVNLLNVVRAYDSEHKIDGSYSHRILGLFDVPWLALATSYGEMATGTEPGADHTQLFPLWRSADRTDGTHSRWFGTFLFGKETDDREGADATHVLWPLIASETRERGDDAGWHFRFLPFAWFTHRANADLTVLPFWYRFEDPIETQYFAVPFFGKNAKKDGSETKTFVVPPLYVHTTEAARSLDRTEVLWPLTNFETHADGWTRRVFPLFSASADQKREHLNVMGLYDREHSEVGDDWLMWPLWNEASGIGEGSRTSILPLLDLRHVFEPKVDGDETAFLWPLASSTRKDDKTTTWFFPFYWHYDNGTNRSWRHVWPLFGSSTQGDYVEQSTLFPFFRLGSNPDGTHTESGFLWPLAGSQHVGDYRTRWIAWLWHDTTEESGSTEQNVLWPLFHSERDTNGTSFWHSLGWLLRSERTNDDKGALIADDFRFGGFLYHSHEEPDRSWASVPFLYKFERKGEDRELRLFYLIPIRW